MKPSIPLKPYRPFWVFDDEAGASSHWIHDIKNNPTNCIWALTEAEAVIKYIKATFKDPQIRYFRPIPNGLAQTIFNYGRRAYLYEPEYDSWAFYQYSLGLDETWIFRVKGALDES